MFTFFLILFSFLAGFIPVHVWRIIQIMQLREDIARAQNEIAALTKERDELRGYLDSLG